MNSLWETSKKLNGSSMSWNHKLAPDTVHWSDDEWRTTTDSKTIDTGLGIHFVDLPTSGLSPDSNIFFTFFWPEANKWEGTDFQVTLGARSPLIVQTET